MCGETIQYRTHVLTISYIDLVIFAHVAQARVGEENFQYTVLYPYAVQYSTVLTFVLYSTVLYSSAVGYSTVFLIRIAERPTLSYRASYPVKVKCT